MPILSDFVYAIGGASRRINFQIHGATLTVDGELHPNYALMTPLIKGLGSHRKDTFMRLIATDTSLLFAYAADGTGSYNGGQHVGYAVSNAYKINDVPAPVWLANRINEITGLSIKYVYSFVIRFDEEDGRIFAWLILRSLSNINNTAIRLPLTLFYRISDLIKHAVLSHHGKALSQIIIRMPLANNAFKEAKLHVEYYATYRFNVGSSFAEEARQFVELVNSILKEFGINEHLKYYFYTGKGLSITVSKNVIPALLGIADFAIVPQSSDLINAINNADKARRKAYEVFQYFERKGDLLEYLNYVKYYGNPYSHPYSFSSESTNLT
ncbi:hypothetical protein [Vulcanisaeta distributa]|uniref:Uncharacterized protein n=1 Tax=Vulcanisaeta distributa (strain DSM 14429 / JCM 11212 / NBRC 100878 / IC-017) TaxID=572478 RepID=E1QS49_VULDI|nr:hypothetical protein [Vulcanisaeta distributa]ADN51881.1 hypothetical protein Vdis_2517 [Vulcanisaeta distributa DSM 14429]